MKPLIILVFFLLSKQFMAQVDCDVYVNKSKNAGGIWEQSFAMPLPLSNLSKANNIMIDFIYNEKVKEYRFEMAVNKEICPGKTSKIYFQFLDEDYPIVLDLSTFSHLDCSQGFRAWSIPNDVVNKLKKNRLVKIYMENKTFTFILQKVHQDIINSTLICMP